MLAVSSRFTRSALAGMAGLGLSLLAGCGASLTSDPAVITQSTPATMTGNIHGGQQVVYNATVRLYSAGSTGYGTGSTLLATTTSDRNGNFQFTKLGTNGTSAGNTSTWACPASTADPQIYITALGGNTQGTGVTTTNNTAAAFIAAIGPCSTVTTATRFILNELTTVATVFSLAQYINPGAAAGSWTLGTNGANTTTSTPQGATGLNNAVGSIANLVSIPSGQLVTNSYAGLGTAAGVTLTATAESAKIVTIADILAACINTTASTSSQCSDLFANATPPAASVTSQPSATFSAPVDVVQAAYYLATNPGSASTAVTTCSTTPTPATQGGCLVNLISSTAPYQPALTAATDWTIGVTYSATGTCVNGNSLIAGPNKVSIDATGNIWFVNAIPTAGAASVVELSPTGTPLACIGAQTGGRGLTIDPSGNVWASFNQTALTGAVQEIPVGASSPVSWTAAAIPLAIASDYAGNIFYSTAASGGGFYEFASPGTSTTPTASTNIATGFSGSGSVQIGYIATDPIGRVYGVSSTAASLFVAAPSGGAFVQGTDALGTNSYGLAVDHNGYLYTGTTCCASGAPYRELEKVTPGAGTAITYTASPLYTAGVNGTRSAAVDGAGNAWYGYELPTFAGPSSSAPATGATYSVGEVSSSGSGTSATFTSLSPNGVTPSACSTSGCYTNGGFAKADFNVIADLAIDPSGNVWVLNGGTNNTTFSTNGTTLTEIVGAGVPVQTPLSTALFKGTIGTKP